MYDKYTKITLKSNKPLDEGAAFYANVKSLEFFPEKEVCVLYPHVKKGEYYYWKLFNFIPLIPFKAKRDLFYYLKDGFRRVYTSDVKEYFEHEFTSEKHKLIGYTLYRRAKVVGICHNDIFDTCRYFDSNESAMEYLKYTKQRCKFYDNELKNC